MNHIYDASISIHCICTKQVIPWKHLQNYMEVYTVNDQNLICSVVFFSLFSNNYCHMSFQYIDIQTKSTGNRVISCSSPITGEAITAPISRESLLNSNTPLCHYSYPIEKHFFHTIPHELELAPYVLNTYTICFRTPFNTLLEKSAGSVCCKIKG